MNDVVVQCVRDENQIADVLGIRWNFQLERAFSDFLTIVCLSSRLVPPVVSGEDLMPSRCGRNPHTLPKGAYFRSPNMFTHARGWQVRTRMLFVFRNRINFPVLRARIGEKLLGN